MKRSNGLSLSGSYSPLRMSFLTCFMRFCLWLRPSGAGRLRRRSACGRAATVCARGKAEVALVAPQHRRARLDLALGQNVVQIHNLARGGGVGRRRVGLTAAAPRRMRTWSLPRSPTSTRKERCLVLTPFSMSVLMRGSTFLRGIGPCCAAAPIIGAYAPTLRTPLAPWRGVRTPTMSHEADESAFRLFRVRKTAHKMLKKRCARARWPPPPPCPDAASCARQGVQRGRRGH